MRIAIDADGTGFTRLAAKIANPDPAPEWLARGLAHFSSFIGNGSQKGDRAIFDDILAQLGDASETLLKYLPLFRELPLGFRSPDDVEVVLAALPRIKADLYLGRPREGRPINVSRSVCAAVMVQCWRQLGRNVGGQTSPLQDACAEYWCECGNDEIGETNDRTNWRRPIERAIAQDQEWVRAILTQYTIPAE